MERTRKDFNFFRVFPVLSPCVPWLFLIQLKPIVQISLDLIDIKEAVDTARIAIDAGVDWLEAGTPLLLAEGSERRARTSL